ncbi:MAG: DUF1761 domain-containing protein [Parvularculaceae bacterium]|nr:DUF1761 domain-containing protein [Parvularculaceae bacterium]
MPKLNLAGIAVASLAFYLIGYLWYGVIFTDAWMAAEGVTPSEAQEQSPVYMIGGLLITILQVIGLSLVLKWKGATGMGAAVTTAAIVWALFALPFCMYAYLYLPRHDSTLLMIDASHLLAGWVVAAAILSRFK